MCKTCWAVKGKRYDAENREKVAQTHRRYLLRTRYGMTPEDYDRLLKKQRGRCAICRELPKANRLLHVDHDHKTDKVRGLLCYKCNSGIGYLKDNAERFKRAGAYCGGSTGVPIIGRFSLLMRERGKIVRGSRRAGENIWTLTGREFDAQVKSYSSYSPLTKQRDDGIRYIGFGTGQQPEVSSVTALVSPIAFDSLGNFLAQLALPTYPLTPTLSTVQYTRSFAELELSVSGTVTLTEAGLYTDGSPTASPPYNPGTRDVTLAAAAAQAPAAYKVFEPLEKTQNFVLEAAWQLRH